MTLGDSKNKVTVKALADLLTAQGVDLDDIGQVRKINAWQGFYKDNDGEAHTVDMAGLEFVPSWEEGPEWPVVDQAKPVRITPRKIKPNTSESKTLAILPDVQAGFWHDQETGDLIPLHDTGAVDIALQVIEAARPDYVGQVGDLLDFTDFSRFRREPGLHQTTQPAVDWVYQMLAIVRAVAPHAEIDIVAGNHDERIGYYLLDNAKAAFGLRRAATTPETWPVLSVPYLLRLDELDITFHPGYPASQRWYRDDLVMEHTKGINTKAVAKRSAVSRVQGHTHRISVESNRVQTGRDTVIDTLTFATGTLSRVDGAVPSYGSSTDLRGMPIVHHEDWSQGVTVLTFTDEPGSPISYEIVPIREGKAIFRGELYQPGRWFDPVQPLV